MGRPTKFKSEYCEELIAWFNKDPNYEKPLEHFSLNGTVKWIDIKLMSNPLPTFLGFAKSIGVDTDTLVEWAKEENSEKYPNFSVSYRRAKELQKWFLIENGLNGLYNPQFAIFAAKNITDMKDRLEQDITSAGEKLEPLKILVVEDNSNLIRGKDEE